MTEKKEKGSLDRRSLLLSGTALVAASALTSEALAQAQKGAAAAPAASGRKPNILFIMGDDIGWFNVSAYNMGMMGYRTPNIDRIGREGAVFTDWYGQQSCTAGRAAFITGQSPIRTGLTKVGLPGAELGLGPLDPSVADVLKTYGYATGQFGKNHLGDRDEHLPTAHGFDEFFGNLYHLNAEEEPENPDYPKDPEFRKRFGPRGVLHSFADGKIDNTGPLTTKRMETIDVEFLDAAKDFINRQHKADKPWFCYFNSTRMHIFTHLKKESEGKTGLGVYPDGMVEHDGMVGELLKLVDDLGVADNTIVVYTTDNGAEVFTWPDGGATPFKGEKATNWEGGFRVPCLIKWPGVIKPGTIVNDICAHEDFIPTFAAANGDTDLVERTMKGTTLNGKTFKVHLDGFNLMPFLKGDVKESPRKEFLYWSDDGDLMALRINQWKIAFIEQHTEINPQEPLGVWQGNFNKLRAPMLYNVRADPFERGPTSILYADWHAHRAFLLVPAQVIVAKYIESFKEFPPRAKAASFTVSDVMEKISTGSPGKN
ncbi:arylsulfatase [Bradyrhizobium sp. Tv2a-2]|uniref:arylsulfatase n=1 Tax=Bradyrhizobium sp. Tv2a-2 TaxID=113395 RepID=UPI00041488AF|nr:arylsulfatase [Bradyrhizobium sp. Tv2a-2]